MSQRHFTLDQAEGLIPELERTFERALQLHLQLRAEQQALGALGHPATPDLLEKLPQTGPPEVRRRRARFRALYEAIAEEIRAVEALGGQVKDLEIGLVDFPTLRGGREEALLCWRFGERRIGFWHGLDSGFRGRHSVDGETFAGDATPRVH